MMEYYWLRVGMVLFIVEPTVISVWAARYDGDESTIVPNYMKRWRKALFKEEEGLWPMPVSEQKIAEAQERITDSESKIEQVPNTAWTTSVTQMPRWAASNMDMSWLNTLARATEEGTQEQTDPAPQQVTNPGMRVIRFKKRLQSLAQKKE